MYKQLVTTFTSAFALSVCAASFAADATDRIEFDMVRAAGVVKSGCLPNAKGIVKVRAIKGTPAGNAIGPNEVMQVYVEGLVPNTEYDFFVIQVPNAPFGMSWYQGDLETNAYGSATALFIGRFNEETFIVSPPPGGVPAPQVHKTPLPEATPDAATSPATAPVHTYHLGLWFNSPDDARAAGCTGDQRVVTPFNGEHNAGIQVLNTSNFKDPEGPLFFLKP
jgi:hypothetical protein